jgi:branched-chain amino acid transport system substrate-binding protein
VPEWRIGWEQGVSYVNNVLGGVNGHPIQTMLCTVDGSPEKSVDCGNKFVEAKVPIVFQGVDFAGGAMLPILKDAGIPVGGHIAWDAQERAALDQARYFGSASPAYGAAQLKNMSQNGAKKVRFFLADVPASHVYDETVLQPTAQKLGLDEKMIYYDAASVDWNVVVQTALADGPDAIGSPAAQEADCVGFVKAARAAAFKNPIYPAACTGYIKALGADSVGTRTYGDLWLVTDPAEAPAAKQAEIKAYTDTMKAAGQDDKVEGLAVAGFSDAVTFQRVFGSLSTFDSKTLKDTLFSAKVDSFMGQQIVCDGTAWKGETNCGNKVLFYEVKDGGDRKLLGTGPVDVAEFQPK